MGNTQNTLQLGDTHALTITDLAFGGEGVGRVDGLAVFVPFTIPGEQVRAEITETHARFARARMVELVEASPHRIAPPCPVYGRCAGCQYQHVTYAEQLRLKEQQVRALFRRIGGITDIPMKPIIPSPRPYGYRSKITLHGPGRPAYVALDKVSRVEIDACPIAREELNAALRHWQEAHPEGLSEGEDLHLRMDAGGRVWTPGEAVGQQVTQKVLGREFHMPMASFFQVNPEVAEHMADAVRQWVRESGAATLVDAYCGVGVFGLLCAENMEFVWSVESDARAVQAAKRNARLLGVKNIRFITARVEKGLGRALARLQADNALCILDPPRNGCPPEVLNTLSSRAVKHILYISCSPDRLARDAKRLVASGYELRRVAPFDMFPHTAHIETVAEFVRVRP
jgi:23S rRNA (uracil1939-C5)-methyltransferase